MAAKRRARDETPGALFRALRAATRSDHVELERFLARLNLGLRKEYAFFLNLHLCALQNLRGDWREEDMPDFTAMLKCLNEDLQTLGTPRLKLLTTPRAPLMFSNRLGVAYVIRQCRLVSKQELGRVARAFPTSYLSFVPSLSWTTYLEQLEQGAVAPKASGDDEVVRGARIAFELLVGILRQARI